MRDRASILRPQEKAFPNKAGCRIELGSCGKLLLCPGIATSPAALTSMHAIAAACNGAQHRLEIHRVLPTCASR